MTSPFATRLARMDYSQLLRLWSRLAAIVANAPGQRYMAGIRLAEVQAAATRAAPGHLAAKLSLTRRVGGWQRSGR